VSRISNQAPTPAGIRTSISKEALLDLPLSRYEGEVCLVSNAQELERAAADILGERVTGFDTETRPAFVSGQSYPPALMQVATAHCVYLFQLRERSAHGLLAEMLADPLVKAGVSVAGDLSQLRKLFEFKDRGVVDLGMVAKRHGLEQTGVRNLAALFLGQRVPKGAKTTNWAAPRLSPQQIAYAAADAWICRELYLRFEKLGMVKPAA
jgi:ribonuclease D